MTTMCSPASIENKIKKYANCCEHRLFKKNILQMKMMAEIIEKIISNHHQRAYDWIEKWEELVEASDIKYHKSCEAT